MLTVGIDCGTVQYSFVAHYDGPGWQIKCKFVRMRIEALRPLPLECLAVSFQLQLVFRVAHFIDHVDSVINQTLVTSIR